MKRPTTNRRTMIIAAAAAAVVALALVLLVVLPRLYRPTAIGTAPEPQAAAAGPERKITATLFYVAEDGVSLETAQREVPFGDPIAEQARYILEAQIAAPGAPHVSAIPEGTVLRAVYVSERGDAFVDLTGEVSSNHTGGTLDELLAVYSIVNALTVNLPAITRVQILIDGKEADTLAGHIDLRQPLSKKTTWNTAGEN